MRANNFHKHYKVSNLAQTLTNLTACLVEWKSNSFSLQFLRPHPFFYLVDRFNFWHRIKTTLKRNYASLLKPKNGNSLPFPHLKISEMSKRPLFYFQNYMSTPFSSLTVFFFFFCFSFLLHLLSDLIIEIMKNSHQNPTRISLIFLQLESTKAKQKKIKEIPKSKQNELLQSNPPKGKKKTENFYKQSAIHNRWMTKNGAKTAANLRKLQKY